MEVFIYKTDITAEKVDFIRPLLNNNSKISEWSVDTEDVDNVLKIKSSTSICIEDIRLQIKLSGFNCEELEG